MKFQSCRRLLFLLVVLGEVFPLFLTLFQAAPAYAKMHESISRTSVSAPKREMYTQYPLTIRQPAAPQKTSTTNTRCRHYTVVAGDTLSAIALRYGLSWPTLAIVNHLNNPDLILVGQQLCIPSSTDTSISSTPPPSSPSSTSSSSVTELIHQIFGPYADQAIRVATCESGLNPAATNPEPVAGSHASGVFQILYPSTWSTTSQASVSPYNAWANITAAYEIFTRDGNSWREWVCQP